MQNEYVELRVPKSDVPELIRYAKAHGYEFVQGRRTAAVDYPGDLSKENSSKTPPEPSSGQEFTPVTPIEKQQDLKPGKPKSESVENLEKKKQLAEISKIEAEKKKLIEEARSFREDRKRQTRAFLMGLLTVSGAVFFILKPTYDAIRDKSQILADISEARIKDSEIHERRLTMLMQSQKEEIEAETKQIEGIALGVKDDLVTLGHVLGSLEKDYQFVLTNIRRDQHSGAELRMRSISETKRYLDSKIQQLDTSTRNLTHWLDVYANAHLFYGKKLKICFPPSKERDAQLLEKVLILRGMDINLVKLDGVKPRYTNTLFCYDENDYANGEALKSLLGMTSKVKLIFDPVDKDDNYFTLWM